MMILLIVSTVGSGCATIRDFAAKQAGQAAGAALAKNVPAPALTDPIRKGGNFCDSAKALGAPVPLDGLPRNAATEFSLAVDEFGVTSGCWPSPK